MATKGSAKLRMTSSYGESLTFNPEMFRIWIHSSFDKNTLKTFILTKNILY